MPAMLAGWASLPRGLQRALCGQPPLPTPIRATTISRPITLVKSKPGPAKHGDTAPSRHCRNATEMAYATACGAVTRPHHKCVAYLLTSVWASQVIVTSGIANESAGCMNYNRENGRTRCHRVDGAYEVEVVFRNAAQTEARVLIPDTEIQNATPARLTAALSSPQIGTRSPAR